ncbi:MAG: Mrp/NBP35 family ATP-binding protein [Caulobacterales bacterium]
MKNGLAGLRAKIENALDTVIDPVSGVGLLAAERISGFAVTEEGRVRFTLEAPSDAVARYQQVRDAAEAAVRAQKGVIAVTAVLTAHDAPAPGVTRVTKGATPPPGPQTAPRRAEGLPGVAAIIAVASAKGGVGKSTVAVNLACAFTALGKSTGLLDADVYGPSAPTLLGLHDRKPDQGRDSKLKPLEAFGLKTMSIGYLVDIDAPMIWRGAMATSAVRQMLDDVAWAPLDILVLDMPPGTGDVQLTIAQRVPLAGAVIVSTPQELALADVRRGVAMFERTHIPILGVIENMAWFETEGVRHHLFGEGGARRTAETFGAPFLGELPLDPALRESGDRGAPLVAAAPDHPMSHRFLAMARKVLDAMAAAGKPAPTIRFA